MTLRSELALTFRSGSNTLFGVLHGAEADGADTGVVILVGGPSYRVGSHRMFVQMARELARHGFPVLRFDFSGMGDSDGRFPGFEHLDRDVAAALAAIAARLPTLKRYVLLGLCDGATAAAFYAPSDSRVAAVALLNPWVHTPVGEAKTYLWHYYPRRLLQRDFWETVIRGDAALGASVRDFAAKVGQAMRRTAGGSSGATSFVERMRLALSAFRGRLFVALSQNDHTALQFADTWTSDERWKNVRLSAHVVRLDGADHTLSARADMQRFCAELCDWLDDVVARRT